MSLVPPTVCLRLILLLFSKVFKCFVEVDDVIDDVVDDVIDDVVDDVIDDDVTDDDVIG
jgi:hypothetical protein